MGYGGMGYGGMGYGGMGYGGMGYGGFGGAYPASGFGYSSAYVAPGAGAGAVAPQRRVLGIDEEPVVLPDGKKGMKIANVYAGTAAEQAGLQVGDVLRSVNGYLTEQRGNLAWIIANATPDNTLKMNVRTARDGQNHAVTATLP
jgi:S1-C subfamily serine protease